MGFHSNIVDPKNRRFHWLGIGWNQLPLKRCDLSSTNQPRTFYKKKSSSCRKTNGESAGFSVVFGGLSQGISDKSSTGTFNFQGCFLRNHGENLAKKVIPPIYDLLFVVVTTEMAIHQKSTHFIGIHPLGGRFICQTFLLNHHGGWKSSCIWSTEVIIMTLPALAALSCTTQDSTYGTCYILALLCHLDE